MQQSHDKKYFGSITKHLRALDYKRSKVWKISSLKVFLGQWLRPKF
jgi:hypothetical protein